ncbi:MAG: NTPase [Candidatus Thermoplasmatota archaeon]
MNEVMKIGITGLPSAGKTHTLIRIIEMIEAEGKSVGGMITEPIIQRGQRVGFYVLDWARKKRKRFAHVKIESQITVGKYGVDLRALDTVGVSAILDACKNADVVVIDEVGKMEVESEKFVAAVKEALDAEKTTILTLHKKSRNPLLQDIRRRDDIRILEVTPINRNLLPYKVMKLLKGELL